MNRIIFDEDYEENNDNNVIDGEYEVKRQGCDENETESQYGYIMVNPDSMHMRYRSRTSDYDLLKVIGQGGYGKVLLVRKNNGPDALLIKNEKDTIHTKSERNILEKLKHKYIVDLIYAFQTNEKLYLVMEYVPGGELFGHLEREIMLTELSCRFYMAELVLALEYLHKNGVVYRDLKPENILLTKTGDIKLTDFGLCKESLGPNKTHTFCGTIEYMAPEIVTRSGHTYCADWWSLGAMMFDMLTGKPPFATDDREKTIQMILRGRVLLPSYLSTEAKELLKNLLIRKPELRLGYGTTDAHSIKIQMFFAGINWDDLLEGKIEPPFIPTLKNDEDTSFFDSCFTQQQPADTPSDKNHLNLSDNLFEGFTYVAPSVFDNLNQEDQLNNVDKSSS